MSDLSSGKINGQKTAKKGKFDYIQAPDLPDLAEIADRAAKTPILQKLTKEQHTQHVFNNQQASRCQPPSASEERNVELHATSTTPRHAQQTTSHLIPSHTLDSFQTPSNSSTPAMSRSLDYLTPNSNDEERQLSLRATDLRALLIGMAEMKERIDAMVKQGELHTLLLQEIMQQKDVTREDILAELGCPQNTREELNVFDKKLRDDKKLVEKVVSSFKLYSFYIIL